MNYKLLIIAVALLHVITNAFWLSINNAPPSWDAANHTLISFKIANQIREFNAIGVLESSEYYPMFVHTLGALLTFAVGQDIKILQLIGTIFFAVAIIVLYLHTKLLYGNSKLAFFSATLFSFFPIVFSESRRFMLDLPLTAMFLVCLYLIEKSKNLTESKFSLYFFVALGLLLITKWTGLVFIAIPLIISLIKVIKTNQSKLFFKNNLIGLPIALLISLPWYFTNFDSFYSLSQINVEAYADQPGNLFSFENLLYYFRLFINYQVSPILALIFFILAVPFYKKANRKWLLVFISLAYLFFTFLSNKDPRYLMPLLPLVAIVIAFGVNEVDKRFKFTNIALLATLAVYFLILTLRPLALEGFRVSIRLPLLDWINIVDINESFVKKYYTDDWRLDAVFEDLAKHSQDRPSEAIIAVENEFFNPSTLLLYHNLNKNAKNINLISPDISYLLHKYSKPAFPNEKELTSYVNNADFILISPLNLGTEYLRNKDALMQLQHYFIGDTLLPCAEFETKVAPRGTTCYVRMGEVLETISDIRINDSPDDKVGLKKLSDFTKVRCPYACSFRQIRAPKVRFDINLVKEYRFPNGLRLQLYKV